METYPEWALGFQVFSVAQTQEFSIDILNATKLIPEELVPVKKVGCMVLNRNPDNYFAETKKGAFCVAHVVTGIDFPSDPQLAGRIRLTWTHKYLACLALTFKSYPSTRRSRRFTTTDVMHVPALSARPGEGGI